MLGNASLTFRAIFIRTFHGPNASLSSLTISVALVPWIQ